MVYHNILAMLNHYIIWIRLIFILEYVDLIQTGGKIPIVLIINSNLIELWSYAIKNLTMNYDTSLHLSLLVDL
jgi:hypothetical protein